MTILHFKHSHWWKRRSRSKFASHYVWGTNGVCECKMDVKVYVNSYMTLNGSCFMVTWIIFKNHHLEVGLTQNRETIALRALTTVGLFYFIHVWGPTWIEIHWNSIWLRAQSHMSSHYTWWSVTTLHDFEGVLGRPLVTFFWALMISWSPLLVHVWSEPDFIWYMLPIHDAYGLHTKLVFEHSKGLTTFPCGRFVEEGNYCRVEPPIIYQDPIMGMYGVP
jgi:hypothetical protein